MDILITHELKKEYRLGEHKVEALRGIDLTVKKGEFVAIMGPSGSGKSTLMHLLGGLDYPTSGEVLLEEKKLSELNDTKITLARRHLVGFVFQFFNLMPTLTAEENILLPVLIDGKKLPNYKDRLNELLVLIGLVDRRNHRPDQLSGGEQQRVAIARALITDPAILLADEPTGNLDTKTGMEIMSLLRRSADEMMQTVVVVSHDPRAASYSDRVVFLKDGLVIKEIFLDPGAELTQKLDQIMEEMKQLGF